MVFFNIQLQADENFQFSLTPETISPGSHAVLKLSVPLNKSETDASVEIHDNILFESPDVFILEKTSERTECCLEIKYELTGYKDISVVLPAFEIKTPGNSFSTERLPLTIQSTRTLEDNELRETFPVLPIPLPYWKWAKRFILWTLFSIVALALLKKVKKLTRTSRRPAQKPRFIPTEDPDIWLKKKLEYLKKKTQEQPQNEFLVDEWSQIIREFVFRKRALPALCWTTKELKKALSEDSLLKSLIPNFEKSDQYKFSLNSKRSESSLNLVTQFITETETHFRLCGNL